MIRSPFLPALLACATSLLASAPGGDSVVTSRRAALELAGAWSNDGFRLRERSWAGILPTDKPAVARVTLLAGNRYWFSAATNAASTTLSLNIYTELGAPISAEIYQDGPLAAAGFAPVASGSYLIALSESHGTPVPFCLVYSYK